MVVEIKAIVRYRDGYRCVECGMTARQHARRYGRGLEVHRIVPGSRYSVDSCVTLCQGCHKDKPKSPRGSCQRGHFQLAIPGELREPLLAVAEATERTLPAVVRLALKQFLAKYGIGPLAGASQPGQ
jgi:hypothetical protein